MIVDAYYGLVEISDEDIVDFEPLKDDDKVYVVEWKSVHSYLFLKNYKSGQIMKWHKCRRVINKIT